MLRLATRDGQAVPRTRLRAFDVDCLGCREITIGDFDFDADARHEDGSVPATKRAIGFRCEHCGSTIGVVGPFMLEVEEEPAHG